MQTHTASSRNRKTFELGSVFTPFPRCSRHRLRTAIGGPRGLHPRGTNLMRRYPFRDDLTQRGAAPTRLFFPPRRRLGRQRSPRHPPAQSLLQRYMVPLQRLAQRLIQRHPRVRICRQRIHLGNLRRYQCPLVVDDVVERGDPRRELLPVRRQQLLLQRPRIHRRRVPRPRLPQCAHARRNVHYDGIRVALPRNLRLPELQLVDPVIPLRRPVPQRTRKAYADIVIGEIAPQNLPQRRAVSADEIRVRGRPAAGLRRPGHTPVVGLPRHRHARQQRVLRPRQGDLRRLVSQLRHRHIRPLGHRRCHQLPQRRQIVRFRNLDAVQRDNIRAFHRRVRRAHQEIFQSVLPLPQVCLRHHQVLPPRGHLGRRPAQLHPRNGPCRDLLLRVLVELLRVLLRTLPRL